MERPSLDPTHTPRQIIAHVAGNGQAYGACWQLGDVPLQGPIRYDAALVESWQGLLAAPASQWKLKGQIARLEFEIDKLKRKHARQMEITSPVKGNGAAAYAELLAESSESSSESTESESDGDEDPEKRKAKKAKRKEKKRLKKEKKKAKKEAKKAKLAELQSP